MFKPRKIECILPGRGPGTRFNIGGGSPRHAMYKNNISKRNALALIESGEHDHISHEFVYYHTNQHGPQTSLIQYGKADDETASNSSIDVSNNHEDKVGNAFTRNSNLAVNRIYEEEIEVSLENKAKMIASDKSFDVTTP